ncbi:anti-sigma-B factor antagonist [bacterium BMS3Abin04]|nr:anti-sigma-B factor antagonist [bacterium BMS3Abin04]
MNTDLFERKKYLSGNLLQMDEQYWFSSAYRKNKDLTIIRVNTPRATLNEASNFQSFLIQSLKNKNFNVIIDFGSCEFIDSTFIGTIVKTFNMTISNSKNLSFVVHNKRQSTLFTMNKLDRIFGIYTNLELALKNTNVN